MVSYVTYRLRDRVEQEVIHDTPLCVLCGSMRCVATFVWYDDAIIAAWYDNVYTLTDSIVKQRYRQGQEILNSLKNVK